MQAVIEKVRSEDEDAQAGPPQQYEIAVYPADYTLRGLYQKWIDHQIKVPPTQRHYVWSLPQASRLIESFLMGLPVPGIFLYRERPSRHLLVVDGQQRLMSVFFFFKGIHSREGKEQPFRLRSVHNRWESLSYELLSAEDKLRLDDTVLRATIVEQLDPKDHTSIEHIFERLNTGGTQLNNQEVRNCVYWGGLNDLMKELNVYPAWRDIFGKVQPDSRQRDIELILRFFALRDRWSQYEKPLKDRLSEYMAEFRNPSPDERERLEDLFVSTFERIRDRLGPKPFHIRSGLNAAAFDCVSVAVADNLGAPMNDLGKRFQTLKEDPKFENLTTSATTDVDTVKGRMQLASVVLFPK